MDSLTEKQAFLSMNGIDKTEENTAEIERLNKSINDFVTNQVPNFCLVANVPQTVQGDMTFSNPIIASGMEIPRDSNQIIFNRKGRNKIILDNNYGTTIVGSVQLDDNTLSVRNIVGLQETLNSISSPNPVQSIDGTQIKLLTIKGANIALETIENQNIKMGTITGDRLAPFTVQGANINLETIDSMNIKKGTITGDRLADNLAIYSSTITHLTVGNDSFIPQSYTTNTYARKYYTYDSQVQINNPTLHINIPFVPILNDSTAVSDISFFVPNVSSVTNPTTRFLFPFTYIIHGISIMYNKETVSNTATINLYLYDIGGNGIKKLLGTADIKTNAGIFSDYYYFKTPLVVPVNKSLGGDHKYSAATSKQVTYVLWAYQG